MIDILSKTVSLHSGLRGGLQVETPRRMGSPGNIYCKGHIYRKAKVGEARRPRKAWSKSRDQGLEGEVERHETGRRLCAG